jgi:hypothetical protein
MKTFILLALMLSTQLIKSQDLIVKLDSSKLQTAIIEISPTEIIYKLFNYNDGPLIRVSKNQIAYIVFKNGAVERYNAVSSATKLALGQTLDFCEQTTSIILSPEEKDAKCEKLYKYNNYVGFNHMAFLNNCLGFNYMRDIKLLNLIINIPISIGYDKPVVTNSLYKGSYIEASDNFNYNRLNYQFGLSALFTPNMKRQVNFLVGPSFYYSSFNVSTELNYTIQGFPSQTFKNDFEIRRKNYGVNVGLMQRFNERFNMVAIITLGYKIDVYNEKDPYGIEFIESNNGSYNHHNSSTQNNNVYANFMWTFGYRF